MPSRDYFCFDLTQTNLMHPDLILLLATLAQETATTQTAESQFITVKIFFLKTDYPSQIYNLKNSRLRFLAGASRDKKEQIGQQRRMVISSRITTLLNYQIHFLLPFFSYLSDWSIHAQTIIPFVFQESTVTRASKRNYGLDIERLRARFIQQYAA